MVRWVCFFTGWWLNGNREKLTFESHVTKVQVSNTVFRGNGSVIAPLLLNVTLFKPISSGNCANRDFFCLFWPLNCFLYGNREKEEKRRTPPTSREDWRTRWCPNHHVTVGGGRAPVTTHKTKYSRPAVRGHGSGGWMATLRGGTWGRQGEKER